MTSSDSKPSQQIIKIARRIAKEESSDAGGWEAVQDVADLKLQTTPERYILPAILEYLDQEQPHE